MTNFERPGPDRGRLNEVWTEWTSGTADRLPGRTVADLKIAGADLVLAAISDATDDATSAAETWNQWERGKVGPEAVLEALVSAGFGDVLAEVA